MGLIVADTCGHVVRRYNPSTSSMEHLGGSGSATIPSDAMLTGVIDKYAAFPSPSAVLVFGSYRYLVALPTLNAVRGVVSDGTVFNVMGDGSASCTPPAAAVATKTCLVTPRAMLLLPDDSILVSEQHAHRVRLWNNGYLYTYAGTGAPGYSEHANATLALFNQPTALALYPGGFILICDTNNHAIRFVAADGSTGTMVGTGSPGFAGDGTGTLVGAMLSSPTGVAVYITGETYIADTGNCRIRKVVNDVITTVAGSACGFGGDNGPAAVSKHGVRERGGSGPAFAPCHAHRQHALRSQHHSASFPACPGACAVRAAGKSNWHLLLQHDDDARHLRQQPHTAVLAVRRQHLHLPWRWQRPVCYGRLLRLQVGPARYVCCCVRWLLPPVPVFDSRSHVSWHAAAGQTCRHQRAWS